MAARLYDLRSSEVIQAQFVFNGTTYGQIDFTLPSGERFKGDYQTVSGAVSSWGAVYSLAWTSSGLAAARTNAALTVAPHEYSGSAVASSDRNRVIECEYITTNSPAETHGHGACRDNAGHAYKLMW